MWVVELSLEVKNTIYFRVSEQFISEYNIWSKTTLIAHLADKGLISHQSLVRAEQKTPVTVQYNVVQYSEVQCSVVQCSAVRFNAVQYSAVQCSTVQCCLWYGCLLYYKSQSKL